MSLRDLAKMQAMLREARLSRGWTKTQLAQEASNLAPPDRPIDPNVIWRLESPERTRYLPPPLVLRPICAALELDLLDVFAAAGYLDIDGGPGTE